MKKILLAILWTVSLASLTAAQEATGRVAEQVKKEIMQFEREKEQAMMSSTAANNYAADWVQRVDAEDIAFTNPYGVYTKAQVVAQFREGKHKTYSVKATDEHIRVYGNGGDGTTAVMTYINESDGTHTGQQRSGIKTRGTDVFIKLDGRWRWIVHHHSFLEGTETR